MIDKATFKKLGMFGMIGFTGMILDYSITALFKEFFEVNKYVANTIGFVCAASNNYYWNRKFTFKSSNPKLLKEYSGFLTIAAAGLVLNNFIIWIMTDVALNLNFYLAKFIAITVVFVWNFAMNNFLNFKQRAN